MDRILVSIFAQIVQAQVELEAMRAANVAREEQGKAPAYGEDHFWTLHGRLENLAYEARQAAA